MSLLLFLLRGRCSVCSALTPKLQLLAKFCHLHTTRASLCVSVWWCEQIVHSFSLLFISGAVINIIYIVIFWPLHNQTQLSDRERERERVGTGSQSVCMLCCTNYLGEDNYFCSDIIVVVNRLQHLNEGCDRSVCL